MPATDSRPPTISAIWLTCVVAFLNSPAWAANIDDDDRGFWLIGPVLGIEYSPYTAVGRDLDPLPYIAYERGPWHLGIDELSYEWSLSDDLSVTMLIDPRYGISRPKNDPRFALIRSETAFEAGFAVRQQIGPAYWQAKALADISDRHNGRQLALSLGRQFELGNGEVDLRISAIYRDTNLNKYLFGVSASQSRPALPAYDPGAAWSAQLGASYIREFGADSAFVIDLDVDRLSDNARASARTSRSVGVSLHTGLIWRF